jgi:magnesium transporter
MEERIEVLAGRLIELAAAKNDKPLVEFLAEVHAADLSEALRELPEDLQDRIFRRLDVEKAGEVLRESDTELQSDLVDAVDEHVLSDILEDMSPDDAADVVGDIEEEKAERVLRMMDEEDRGEIQELLQYPEDSAGGIMTSDFIAFPADMTVGEAQRILRSRSYEKVPEGKEESPEQRAARIAHEEDVYYVYVTDREGLLEGFVSLRDLLLAAPKTVLGDLMHTNFLSVTVDTDQEEVARMLSKYDFPAVPVVDQEGVLVGRITFDDALDVVEEEASEDIMRIAGSSAEELGQSSLRQALRARLPWLIGTMVAELICAAVIAGFAHNITVGLIALTYFIPMIMAMGGSTGNQSATLVIRGLATGQSSLGQARSILWYQFRVGLSIGVICGALVWGAVQIAFAAGLIQGSQLIGPAIGLAMVIAVVFSSLMGALVPIGLSYARIDPAVAAVPFIASLNDVTGLIIYFGLATIILNTLQ